MIVQYSHRVVASSYADDAGADDIIIESVFGIRT